MHNLPYKNGGLGDFSLGMQSEQDNTEYLQQTRLIRYETNQKTCPPKISENIQFMQRYKLRYNNEV